MVRALASHQCGPGSSLGSNTICGLSLLLVLSFAPRSFFPVLHFPLPQKPTLLNFNSIWKARTSLNEFLRSPKCFVGEQTHSPSVNESSLKLVRPEKMIKKFLLLIFSITKAKLWRTVKNIHADVRSCLLASIAQS